MPEIKKPLPRAALYEMCLLAEEQHFSVLWQQPVLVANEQFELVDMVPDLIKECFFHICSIGDRFFPCIGHGVANFTGFDHLKHQVAHFADMVGNSFQDLLSGTNILFHLNLYNTL